MGGLRRERNEGTPGAMEIRETIPSNRVGRAVKSLTREKNERVIGHRRESAILLKSKNAPEKNWNVTTLSRG